MSGQATGESVEHVIEELRARIQNVRASSTVAHWNVTKVYQDAAGWCRVTVHLKVNVDGERRAWAFAPRFRVWDDAVLVRLAAIDMLAGNA